MHNNTTTDQQQEKKNMDEAVHLLKKQLDLKQPVQLMAGFHQQGKRYLLTHNGFKAVSDDDSRALFVLWRKHKEQIILINSDLLNPKMPGTIPLLLASLKKLRLKQIRLLLVFSLSILFENEAEDLKKQLVTLQSLSSMLTDTFPVNCQHIIFTHCDLIAGFHACYHCLPRSIKNQPLGFALNPHHPSHNWGTQYDDAFNALHHVLNQHQLLSMQLQSDKHNLQLCLEFPAQMMTLQAPIKTLLTQLSQGHAQCFISNIYFTSHLQRHEQYDFLSTPLNQLPMLSQRNRQDCHNTYFNASILNAPTFTINKATLASRVKPWLLTIGMCCLMILVIATSLQTWINYRLHQMTPAIIKNDKKQNWQGLEQLASFIQHPVIRLLSTQQTLQHYQHWLGTLSESLWLKQFINQPQDANALRILLMHYHYLPKDARQIKTWLAKYPSALNHAWINNQIGPTSQDNQLFNKLPPKLADQAMWLIVKHAIKDPSVLYQPEKAPALLTQKLPQICNTTFHTTLRQHQCQKRLSKQWAQHYETYWLNQLHTTAQSINNWEDLIHYINQLQSSTGIATLLKRTKHALLLLNTLPLASHHKQSTYDHSIPSTFFKSLSQMHQKLQQIHHATDQDIAHTMVLSWLCQHYHNDPQDPLNQLLALRTPNTPLLNQVIDHLIKITWTQIVHEGVQTMDQFWHTQIYQRFQSTLAQRFPLDSQSTQDAPLEDFSTFFILNSPLFTFYQKVLAGLIDQEHDHWQWKHLHGIPLHLNSDALSFIIKSIQIHTLYFQNASQLGIDFNLKPIAWPDQLTDFIIHSEDDPPIHFLKNHLMVSSHHWPNLSNNPLSVLTLKLIDRNHHISEVTFTGPWAWFKWIRTYRQLQHTTQATQMVPLLIRDQQGNQLPIQLITEHQPNPFTVTDIHMMPPEHLVR